MIRLLSRLLALLLATALVLTASVWILSHTLGSPTYLEQMADSQGTYQKLADQLPGGTNVELLRSQIQEFLPKVFTALGGIDPGAAITLPGTDTPITPVAPDSALAAIVQASGQLSWVGPAVCVVLIIFILAVGRASRWRILSGAFMHAAIGLGLTAGLLWISPGFVVQNMTFAGLAGLKAALEPYIQALMHDIAWQFIYAALGALAVSILLRITHTVVGLALRFKKPKSSPPPPPPTGFPGRLQD